MNLKKAIEILTLMGKSANVSSREDCVDAIKLGMEASKAWEHIRKGATPQHLWKLPGETKD